MNDTPDLTKPDALGRPHDPAKFLPKLDSLGRWVNRNTGRPRKHPGKTPFRAQKTPPANESQPEPMQTNEQTPPPASTPPEMNIGSTISFDDIEKAATEPPPASAAPAKPEEELEPLTTAETIIGILQTALVIIGQEEGVLSENEKRIISSPLKRVLKKYNIGDDILPCELDLAVALAMIIIARLKKPKTATTWERCKAWAVGKWFRRKGEKTAKQVSEAIKPAEVEKQ